MTNHLLKIAGIGALSALTLAGMSVTASSARAAEEEEVTALNPDEGIDADNEATGESSEAIHRHFYRYPGYYNPWRGYRYYPRGYFRRPYYPYYYYPRYRYYPVPYGPWGYPW